MYFLITTPSSESILARDPIIISYVLRAVAAILHNVHMKMDENYEIVDFKGKSKVWEYFGFKKVQRKDGPPEILKEKVICKVCKNGYKYTGGTTNY